MPVIRKLSASTSALNCVLVAILLVVFPISAGVYRANFQVVHFLDPSDENTAYYASWNSDQWINWLRERFEKESESRRQPESLANFQTLQGSWVNIVIIAAQEDFKIAYASDSMHAYADPQRSDYFWSDYAYPVYVILRSPNATVNVTQEEATGAEEHETRQRTIYGFNVYNCAEKKMFVNAKIDPETEEPIHFQTFFPKKVKNPKDKLRVPLSVCSKVAQSRDLLDDIRYRLT